LSGFEANAVDYVLAHRNERLQKHCHGSQAPSARQARGPAGPAGPVSAIAGKHHQRRRDRWQHFPVEKPASAGHQDAGKTAGAAGRHRVDRCRRNYMCVHAAGATHIMRKTMKELEQELDPGLLQRIHRSTIVNVKQVKEMRSHINGEYFLTLKNGFTIKLSRNYKDKLKYFSGW
jgi:hypothetical protein